MSSGLNIDITEKDQTATIVLSGRIDEDAHFENVSGLEAKKFTFDFKEVSLINSCGVREWINLINKLIKKGQVIYKNCPQVMIEQMNMVEGFLPNNASIESFFAPYFDPDLDQEKKILLMFDEVKSKKAPIKKNEKGTELEFDALEAQFFNFIK